MGKTPSEILKDAKEKVKRKQQEKKEETKMSNKKTITVTVLVTLGAVLVAGALVYLGVNIGAGMERSKNAEIQAAVVSVKPTQAEPAPSK